MAAGVGTETPNELMVVFSDTVTAGFDAISGAVSGVFGLMIALVVALTGIQWALSSNREVLAAGFGKVLLIGAFAWLINDWQALSETIYDGFIEIGLLAGGSAIGRDEFLNPGAIVEQGWLIVKALGETPAPVDNPLDVIGNLMDALILAIAMLGIMIAFAVLALQIIVALLEFKIVTLGGFVLLPFGIWSKSAFLAERPLGYVVSSGLKVLAMAIVVSGARTVFDQLIPSENPDIYEALTILVAALLLAMLAIYIPNLAAALVTGGPALGAGAAVSGGMAVGGAAALAGAGLMKLGSMIPAGKSSRAQQVGQSSRAAAGAGSGRSGPPPAPASPISSPSSPGSGPLAERPANDRGRPPGASSNLAGLGAGSRPPAADLARGGQAAAGREAAHTPAAPLVEEANPRRNADGRGRANRGDAASKPLPLFDDSAAGAPSAGANAATSSTAAVAPDHHPSRPPSGSAAAVGAGARAPSAATSAGQPSGGNPGAGSASGSARSSGTTSGSPTSARRRSPGDRARRSAALQAFFVANAGRGLLPSDSVGAVTPDLKREDR